MSMPVETKDAVSWALSQTVDVDGEVIHIARDTPHFLVDKVREYFNENGINYSTFSFDDLVPYLN